MLYTEAFSDAEASPPREHSPEAQLCRRFLASSTGEVSSHGPSCVPRERGDYSPTDPPALTNAQIIEESMEEAVTEALYQIKEDITPFGFTRPRQSHAVTHTSAMISNVCEQSHVGVACGSLHDNLRRRFNIFAPRPSAQSFRNFTKGRLTDNACNQVMSEDSSLNEKSWDILSDVTLEKMSKGELIKVIQQLQVRLQTSDTTVESNERK